MSAEKRLPMAYEAVPKLPGPIAAAITPRNTHGEIDFGAAFELIDFLCRGGVRGIALSTPAGEYASLAPEERSRLIYLAAKRSRAPIYAGVGAATLDGALTLAREARDGGAKALLLPPPHGFAYGQDDIREFYLQFAGQAGAGIPIYLMDAPGLATPISKETAEELVATGRFAGVADFLDEAACAAPELVVAGMSSELSELVRWIGEFPAPVAVKTAVAMRGIKTGPLAAPLTAAKQGRLEEFRAWFAGLLPAGKKLRVHG